MNPASEITKLRHRVLAEVATFVFEKPLEHQVEDNDIKRLVQIIVPEGPPKYRCCIYKERAIAKDRLRIALGLSFTDQVIAIIPEACNICNINKFIVTDACQNCVAHPCRNSCPKKAISVFEHRAFIDHNICVECGLCAKSCPYHAIVEVTRPCERVCAMGAVSKNESNQIIIDLEKCVSCGSCVSVCPFGAITDTSKMAEVIHSLRRKGKPVVAILAPAIAGQFGTKISPGQITSALMALGFDEVVEAAFGADLVAAEEAEEIKNHLADKFMTNSCCPAHVKAVKIKVPELADKISTVLSPMRVTGQIIKERYQNEVVTVFIGPCMAKKEEAKQGEEIDIVITFEELAALFEGGKVDVGAQEEKLLEGPSSFARNFPRTGGVSEAVARHLTGEPLEILQSQGLRQTLPTLKAVFKKSQINNDFIFVECMSCEDGCVGGPGALAKATVATRAVEKFAATAKKQG